jgi:hypothetical protein
MRQSPPGVKSQFRDRPATFCRIDGAGQSAYIRPIGQARPSLWSNPMTNIDLASKSKDELLAIIEAMSRASRAKLTMKVSEKGALSIYGMGRWPITLYKSQWDRLLSEADAIRGFIKANAASLAEKPQD